MTHGFKNGRLFAEQGTNERTGAGEIWKYDNGSDNVQTFMSDGSPEGVHAADKGSFAHDYTNGCVYYKTTDTVATGWVKAGATVPQAEMKQNLGFTYAAGSGTFTVRGSNASLSASNPAYVTLQSKSSPGDNVLYTITADQSFIDDNGASEIVGNLFGLTTSVAWAQDIPFFLYAVGNDDEDTIAFMISRNPAASFAPAAANIGAPDDAVADAQRDFFSLENIDETLYDQNPCLCIGAFRMQMSASDDWTVQTLSTSDGIGRYHEKTLFTLPSGVHGAASGTYFLDAGGQTEPTFTSSTVEYRVGRDGMCWMYANHNAVNNTPSGGTAAKHILPYEPAIGVEGFEGFFEDDGAAIRYQLITTIQNSTPYCLAHYLAGTGTTLANGSFQTNDEFSLVAYYAILG
jgi:hypothetical protein